MRAEDLDLPDIVAAGVSSRSLASRLLWALSGIVLIIVGVIGWILPFMPGVPLVVLGLVVLSWTSEWVRRGVNATERRLPTRLRMALRRKNTARTDGRRLERFFEER